MKPSLTTLAPFVLVALALSANPAPDKAAKAEAFGKPLKGGAPTDLAEIVKAPDAFAGKTVRTEGKVSAVCQDKGCWMTLQATTDKTVRVTFEDYSFFVPKDISGATVTLEGTVKVKTIPEATAKHYAAETPGKNPELIKGDQKEITFVATGVELTRGK